VYWQILIFAIATVEKASCQMPAARSHQPAARSQMPEAFFCILPHVKILIFTLFYILATE
jgi:hypothetical protein